MFVKDTSCDWLKTAHVYGVGLDWDFKRVSPRVGGQYDTGLQPSRPANCLAVRSVRSSPSANCRCNEFCVRIRSRATCCQGETLRGKRRRDARVIDNFQQRFP